MQSRYTVSEPSIAVSTITGETLASIKPLEIDFRNPALFPNVTSQLTSGLRNNASLRGLGAQYRQIENTINSVPSWGATFGGSDMNKLSYQSVEDLDIALEFIFDPGTCFVPDNKDYQVMMYADPTVSFTTQYSNLFASLSPFVQGKASLKTMCLNMGKKEPAGHVKYYPAVLKDKVLPKLAKIVADSSRRGPWDQARVWIYTDKATLSDIHERLAPPIAPGYYVRGLRDVEQAGGFEEKDLKNAKLFDPSLVFAPTGVEDATTFFLNNMLANHARALKAVLEKPGDESDSLFTSAGKELKAEHLNLTMGILLDSGNKDSISGMLTYLEKHVPIPSREWVKEMKNMVIVFELEEHADGNIAKQAKKVKELYKL